LTKKGKKAVFIEPSRLYFMGRYTAKCICGSIRADHRYRCSNCHRL